MCGLVGTYKKIVVVTYRSSIVHPRWRVECRYSEPDFCFYESLDIFLRSGIMPVFSEICSVIRYTYCII